MTWPIRGWQLWVLVGLGLAAIGVGLLARLVPTHLPEELDVVYGEAGGTTLRLDIYRPEGEPRPRPGVLLIHGGGWSEGDKSSLRRIAKSLTRAGYVAISVGYRLAKDDASRHPAQADDVRLAARWVRANARRVGVDPERLGAFGQSAGGHLAALLGTTESKGTPGLALNDLSSRVVCVVDCCGPTDFTEEGSPALTSGGAGVVPNLFGKAREQVPEAYRDASPVTHVDARSAPTLIIHGTADEVVPLEQSTRFRDALERARVEVRLVELPDEGHLFLTGGSSATMLRETLEFLGRHLKP